MTITTTAIGFSLLSLGLAFCGIRFFKAFQNIDSIRAGRRIGIFVSAMFFSNAVALGILAIGTLFFARNPEVLYMFLLVSHFPLTITAMFGVYAVFYILFPSISARPAVAVALCLGVTVIILTMINHPLPFVDTNGGINWNMPKLLETLLAYLVFTNIGAQLAVFLHSFLQARSREVKVVSLIIIFVSIMGIVNTIMRFLLPEGIFADLSRIRIFDIMFIFMGLIFISIFLLPPIIIKWISRTRDHQT